MDTMENHGVKCIKQTDSSGVVFSFSCSFILDLIEQKFFNGSVMVDWKSGLSFL